MSKKNLFKQTLLISISYVFVISVVVAALASVGSPIQGLAVSDLSKEPLENNKVYNFTSLDSNANLAFEVGNFRDNDPKVYVRNLDTNNPNQQLVWKRTGENQGCFYVRGTSKILTIKYISGTYTVVVGDEAQVDCGYTTISKGYSPNTVQIDFYYGYANISATDLNSVVLTSPYQDIISNSKTFRIIPISVGVSSAPVSSNSNSSNSMSMSSSSSLNSSNSMMSSSMVSVSSSMMSNMPSSSSSKSMDMSSEMSSSKMSDSSDSMSTMSSSMMSKSSSSASSISTQSLVNINGSGSSSIVSNVYLGPISNRYDNSNNSSNSGLTLGREPIMGYLMLGKM